LQFSQPVPGAYPPAPPPPQVVAGRNKMPPWACVLSGCGCAFLIVPILAAIIFPVFAKARERARQITCASNEKQMGVAFMQYVQDYDGKMPPANTWMDATYPYAKFQLHCPDANGQYGYAYYSKLSSAKLSNLADPSAVPVIYDSTNTGKNVTDPLTSMPSPGIHSNANNYSFADGHVDSLETPPSP